MWADLSNAAYRDLIVNYVAPRLAARGVDGFFLDNMEVVEHGAGASEGPCGAACAQGGLDLVWELRQKFPDKLIVMQNATSDVTRLGTTHGMAYPSLLDGISHEEVYSNGGDAQSRSEMLAWKAMHLTVAGNPFWLACEEYVGACDAADKSAANALYAQAMADGLNAYVTDASAMQTAPCFWSDFP
jgi:cysteinyl-tRNA synthetase